MRLDTFALNNLSKEVLLDLLVYCVEMSDKSKTKCLNSIIINL